MIDRICETQLTAAEEAEIAALLREGFPTDYGGRSFYRQRPTQRLVWREGHLLGHVALFCRAIRLDGDLVDILGLGDIATAPGARGRGIATALMSRALGIGQAGPARFALLFGARTLYDRAGFKPAANPYVHVEMTGAKTDGIARATSPYLKVRPLGDAIWPEAAEIDFLGPLF